MVQEMADRQTESIWCFCGEYFYGDSVGRKQNGLVKWLVLECLCCDAKLKVRETFLLNALDKEE
jgi:hypothetical protein